MNANIPPEYIDYVSSLESLYLNTTMDMCIEFEPLESLEDFNKDIEIEEYAKGFYAFACDGGNEVYVFDREGKVYLLPLVGMSSDSAKKLADSWLEFTKKVIANA